MPPLVDLDIVQKYFSLIVIFSVIPLLFLDTSRLRVIWHDNYVL